MNEKRYTNTYTYIFIISLTLTIYEYIENIKRDI